MKIGVIGLGYVGLPLALHFAEKSTKVTGFDTDISKVESINSGISPIGHIKNDRISSALNNLSATDDPASMAEVDAIIICVPTPLTAQREPDLSYIRSTINLIEALFLNNRGYFFASCSWIGRAFK